MHFRNEEKLDAYLDIIIIGDCNVGKTSLVSMYIDGIFPVKPQPTEGVQSFTKIVPLEQNVKVKAYIYDISGISWNGYEIQDLLSSCDGAVLLYDVTNRESFFIAKEWLEELKRRARPDIRIELFGNKIDLVEKNPEMEQVTYDEGEDFADLNCLSFRDISAINPKDVEDVFGSVLYCSYKKYLFRKNKRNKSGLKLSVMSQQQRSSKCFI